MPKKKNNNNLQDKGPARNYGTSLAVALKEGVQKLDGGSVMLVKSARYKYYPCPSYQLDTDKYRRINLVDELLESNQDLVMNNEGKPLRFPNIQWGVEGNTFKAKCVFCQVVDAEEDRETLPKTLHQHHTKENDIGLIRRGKILEAKKKSDEMPERIELLVKNDTTSVVVLVSANVRKKFGKACKVSHWGQPCTINPTEEMPVTIRVYMSKLEFGYLTIPIHFTYRSNLDSKGSQQFVYFLNIIVQSELIQSIRNNNLPLCAPSKEDEIPGSKVTTKDEDSYQYAVGNFTSLSLQNNIQRLKPLQLPDHKRPTVYSDFAKAGGRRERLTPIQKDKLTLIETSLGSELTCANYKDKFSALLHLEEHHESKEMAEFNIIGTFLRKTELLDSYNLFVGDGLADGRPSLMKGDKVLVRKSKAAASGSEVNYIAIVKKVASKNVIIKIKISKRSIYNEERFADIYTPNTKFDIEFLVNTFQYGLCHNALEVMDADSKALGMNILIPEISKFSCNVERRKMNFLSKDIESNPEQAQAVTSILNKTSLPYPYVLFGPPGTGKTKTIVEAILMNWAVDSYTRRNQLVCTTSNAAADLIVEKLLDLAEKNSFLNFNPVEHIMRIYSKSVEYESISQKIKMFGVHNYDQSTGEFVNPAMTKVVTTPIIVGTLAIGARFASPNIPRNHFSHVFIDECGHCSEPESLMVIAGIVTNKRHAIKTQLVLAGDPQQLGASARCELAKLYRFGYSLLERLINTCEMYGKDRVTRRYDPNVLMKLIRNFRSHDAILLLPNKLFYAGALKESGNPAILDSCCSIGFVPKNFPVLFHGTTGFQEKDKSSPSYYNLFEVDLVVSYIQKIIREKRLGKMNWPTLTQDDIGVVTPYKKQVQKLEAAFDRMNWGGITVGSVDVFQGNEKLIMLISTVRSFRRFEGKWGRNANKRELTFLNDPKRFNVAVTRAKSLLIVVGNPVVLEHQSYWKLLIDYCLCQGSYAGFLPEQCVVSKVENETVDEADYYSCGGCNVVPEDNDVCAYDYDESTESFVNDIIAHGSTFSSNKPEVESNWTYLPPCVNKTPAIVETYVKPVAPPRDALLKPSCSSDAGVAQSLATSVYGGAIPCPRQGVVKPTTNSSGYFTASEKIRNSELYVKPKLNPTPELTKPNLSSYGVSDINKVSVSSTPTGSTKLCEVKPRLNPYYSTGDTGVSKTDGFPSLPYLQQGTYGTGKSIMQSGWNPPQENVKPTVQPAIQSNGSGTPAAQKYAYVSPMTSTSWGGPIEHRVQENSYPQYSRCTGRLVEHPKIDTPKKSTLKKIKDSCVLS